MNVIGLRKSVASLLAGMLILPVSSIAAIISNPASLVDHGTFVTDTSTNRDWLKFDLTAGLSYDQAVAAFSGDGWQVATGAQVQGFESLFGWTSDTPSSGVNQNDGLTDAMAGYLGYTTNSGGNPRFIWATIEDSVGSLHWNTYAIHSQDLLTYHDYVTTYNILSAADFSNGPGYANWMTRESVTSVPEPQTHAMFLLGLAFLAVARRKGVAV